MSPVELQKAIDFLSGLETTRIDWSQLPDRPDYAAVARLAQTLGQDLEDGTLQEAFRVIMQVRSIRSGPVSPF